MNVTCVYGFINNTFFSLLLINNTAFAFLNYFFNTTSTLIFYFFKNFLRSTLFINYILKYYNLLKSLLKTLKLKEHYILGNIMFALFKSFLSFHFTILFVLSQIFLPSYYFFKTSLCHIIS